MTAYLSDFATAIAVVIIVLVFLFGFSVGIGTERKWWKGEMVERGHAMYHHFDGAWYWMEDIPKVNAKYRDPAARKVAAQHGEK